MRGTPEGPRHAGNDALHNRASFFHLRAVPAWSMTALWPDEAVQVFGYPKASILPWPTHLEIPMNRARVPRAHQADHQRTALAALFAPLFVWLFARLFARLFAIFGGDRLASRSVLLFALAFAGLPALGQAAEDTGAGRYLAANCANCHGTQGRNPADKGVSLAGLKAEFIVEQMRAFREGKRQATVMHQIARGYSDEQIRTLATYFARQVGK